MLHVPDLLRCRTVYGVYVDGRACVPFRLPASPMREICGKEMMDLGSQSPTHQMVNPCDPVVDLCPVEHLRHHHHP